MSNVDTESRILFRPVGQQELELIQSTRNTAFPPRLLEQPFFYPVLTEEYATQIARDWNAKYNDPKCGYVTRFRVRKSFLDRYEVKTVGSDIHQEYWIPAKELGELNDNIVGKIEVIAEFRN
jgi:hypothetical protein